MPCKRLSRLAIAPLQASRVIQSNWSSLLQMPSWLLGLVAAREHHQSGECVQM